MPTGTMVVVFVVVVYVVAVVGSAVVDVAVVLGGGGVPLVAVVLVEPVAGAVVRVGAAVVLIESNRE